ncbi:MAG: serine/threonine-protein kinase [Armatimonadota bacterium]|nr:serine/threonine-protein kinase [Armatimonadota bacterium]
MATNTLGHYQIVREIGRSNDIVYEAIDTRINRRVALKELVIPPNLTGQQRRERIERFYREARAAGSLTHPNIVTIYEAGEDQGRHFIAMEYLEGQSLRNILEIEGQISVDRAIEIISQVCDGLAFAHSKRVIHRDIKPDNIHILPSGLVKITDFGIARLMEEPSLTANGQVFGTPSYMSPEQIAGKQLDHRTDIFSLGIVIYEMLTGKKPFTGDSVVTITYNIMNQDVVIPPTIPPFMANVIRRCLAKDPNMRYQSAEEIKADLNPSAYQQPVAQPDPFGSTVGMPGGWYGGPQTPPIPPLPTGDQLGGSKPDDIVLPKLPSKPLLSPEAKYFLKVMFAVLFACAVVVAFIWAFSAAYQGYQRQFRQQEIQVLLDAGKRYFDSESYLAAIQEWSKALKLAGDPDVAKAIRRNIAACYLRLGNQAEQGGDYTRAITFYQQALVYDKEYADAHLFLGDLLRRVGREDEALSEFETVVKLEPSSEAGSVARQHAAVIYVTRGDEAYKNGDVEGAVAWWRKAVKIAPGTDVGDQAQARIDNVVNGG